MHSEAKKCQHTSVILNSCDISLLGLWRRLGLRKIAYATGCANSHTLLLSSITPTNQIVAKYKFYNTSVLQCHCSLLKRSLLVGENFLFCYFHSIFLSFLSSLLTVTACYSLSFLLLCYSSPPFCPFKEREIGDVKETDEGRILLSLFLTIRS